jgi:hypothetical protein
MKKVALSLLALALVGAGAFAQEAPALKIGGYLDFGTLTTIKADSGIATEIKGDDSGIEGASYEFRLAYGTAKAGFISNVRVENLQGGAAAVYDVQSAYTWFLVPGAEIVKVQAGNYNNDGTAWNQPDDKGDKATAGTGVAVQVTPAEGLTVGAGVAVPDKASYVSNLSTWSFGGIYTVPSTVAINVAGYTGANKDNATALAGFQAGFKLLAAGPLSAKGGLNIYGLNSDKSYSQNLIDVTLGYAITDAFSAGLLTYVWTYGSDIKAVGTDATKDANISYKINPSISYTVDPVTSVGFGATYQQGSGLVDYTKFAATSPLNKLSLIEVNPNATFTIDANTKVYVNYLYDAKSGDDKPATDATWSTFKVDYRYTF